MLHLTLKDGEGVEMRQGNRLLGFFRITRDAGRNRIQIDLPEIRVIRRKRKEIKELLEEPSTQAIDFTDITDPSDS